MATFEEENSCVGEVLLLRVSGSAPVCAPSNVGAEPKVRGFPVRSHGFSPVRIRAGHINITEPLPVSSPENCSHDIITAPLLLNYSDL